MSLLLSLGDGGQSLGVVLIGTGLALRQDLLGGSHVLINAGLTGLEVYLGVTGTETLAVSDVKSNKGAGSAQGTNPVKLVVRPRCRPR